eukprot:1285535-Ditylum_brightwellii.AAC.1
MSKEGSSRKVLRKNPELVDPTQEHNDLPDSEDNMVTLDATSQMRKKQLAAGKRNIVAMTHITMVLGTKALLNK